MFVLVSGEVKALRLLPCAGRQEHRSSGQNCLLPPESPTNTTLNYSAASMKACKSSLRLAPANVFGMFPCEVDCPDTGSDPSYLEQDGPLTDKPKGGVSRISSASRPPRGRVSSAWTSRRVWKQDSLSSDQKPKSADLDNASSRQLQWAVEQVTMPSGYNRLYDLWDDEDSDSLSEPGLEHEGPIHGRSHQEDGNQDDQADTHSCDLDKINVSDGNPSVIWSNGLVYEWDAEKRIFVRSEPANAVSFSARLLSPHCTNVDQLQKDRIMRQAPTA
jgi:hypothetical protein